GEFPPVGDHRGVRHEALELFVSTLDVRQALEHRAQVPAPARPEGTGLRGLRAGSALDAVLALEALDPAGGIDELLLAREERMARRADLDVDLGHGGTGLDDIAAGTDDLGLVVPRMNAFLHEKDATIAAGYDARNARPSDWPGARPKTRGRVGGPRGGARRNRATREPS